MHTEDRGRIGRSIAWKTILAFGLGAFSGSSHAETLKGALAKAYRSNPTLEGARAGLRASDEDVELARSAGRPTLSTTMTLEHTATSGGQAGGSVVAATPASASAALDVPLFSGGSVRNSILAERTRGVANRQTLKATVSDILVQVVRVYLDVLRDEAVVGLNEQNVKVLEVNARAAADRFQVGDLTRTDVAQSDARLAAARAQLATAHSMLASSREEYIRLIGEAPVGLESPPPLPKGPSGPEEALAIALQANPALLAARGAAFARVYDVRVAVAATAPRIGLGATARYAGNLSGQPGGGTSNSQSGPLAQAGLSLSVPLYQGGLPAARTRQAQALRGQALEAATGIERSVVSQVRTTYATWRSLEGTILAAEAAVSADRLSLEGVRAENGVGNRTVLDVLNAQQELFGAEVTLVRARHDAYVARFDLQSAMGLVDARGLGLDPR